MLHQDNNVSQQNSNNNKGKKRKRSEKNVIVVIGTYALYDDKIHQGLRKEAITRNAYHKRKPVRVLKKTSTLFDYAIHTNGEETEEITLNALYARRKAERDGKCRVLKRKTYFI